MLLLVNSQAKFFLLDTKRILIFHKGLFSAVKVRHRVVSHRIPGLIWPRKIQFSIFIKDNSSHFSKKHTPWVAGRAIAISMTIRVLYQLTKMMKATSITGTSSSVLTEAQKTNHFTKLLHQICTPISGSSLASRPINTSSTHKVQFNT